MPVKYLNSITNSVQFDKFGLGTYRVPKEPKDKNKREDERSEF